MLNLKKITLGTQTFGLGTSFIESNKILDHAHDIGINSIDTAERYPFPESKETIGLTEEIIGAWLKKRIDIRNKITIATKVTGRSDNDWFHEGGRLTSNRILSAIDASLKRLNIERIDTYYLHWPDRYTNNFGRKYYNPDNDPIFIPLEDQLSTLKRAVELGKIKKIGISNETAWGFMKIISIAKGIGIELSDIQNEYSLIRRDFEIANSEISLREDVKLKAYSPLAFGLLTGKYCAHSVDANSRLLTNPIQSKRYINEKDKIRATVFMEYCLQNGYEPIGVAVNYILSKPFVGSVILGMRTFEQFTGQLSSIANCNHPSNYSELEKLIESS